LDFHVYPSPFWFCNEFEIQKIEIPHFFSTRWLRTTSSFYSTFILEFSYLSAFLSVTWQHINNLNGEYGFSDEKLKDSVGLNAPEILAVNEV